jgi:hypothetical protein
MDDIEIQKSIQERLKSEHGDVVRMKSHDAPDWFGDGWLVSFEVPPSHGHLAVGRAAHSTSPGVEGCITSTGTGIFLRSSVKSVCEKATMHRTWRRGLSFDRQSGVV